MNYTEATEKHKELKAKYGRPIENAINAVLAVRYQNIGVPVPDALQTMGDKLSILMGDFKVTEEELIGSIPPPPKTYEITIKVAASGQNNHDLLQDVSSQLSDAIESMIGGKMPDIVKACKEVEAPIVLAEPEIDEEIQGISCFDDNENVPEEGSSIDLRAPTPDSSLA